MPTRRRAPSRSSRRGSPRRTVWWYESSAPAAVAIAGNSVFDLTPIATIPGSAVGGFTIVRAIMTVTMRASVINLDAFGSFGVLVAPASAIAALPDAILDLADWYWHKNFFVRDTGGDSMVEYDIDLRSSRRVRGEARSLFHRLTVNAGAGSGINFSITGRFLLSV